MIEAMKRWRDVLAATRVMGRDEQGNYTRELTPKATLDTLAEMDAAIKAAGEPVWFLTEQGQLFATRGAAERMAVGQKITPLWTHPTPSPLKRLTEVEIRRLAGGSLMLLNPEEWKPISIFAHAIMDAMGVKE